MVKETLLLNIAKMFRPALWFCSNCSDIDRTKNKSESNYYESCTQHWILLVVAGCGPAERCEGWTCCLVEMMMPAACGLRLRLNCTTVVRNAPLCSDQTQQWYKEISDLLGFLPFVLSLKSFSSQTTFLCMKCKF